MKSELSELYGVMTVDYRDQKMFPNVLIAPNLQAIETEMRNVTSQTDAR
jgi:hypothetical protein